MAGEPRLATRLDLPARLDSIAVIQEAIEAAAEGVLDTAPTFRLTMSVEELVTNVVQHGGAQGTIGVVILVTPDSFSVELIDEGPAFDPFHEGPPPVLDAALEDRPIGGLGIHLVGKMVDQHHYHRLDGRNHVLLKMARPLAADGGENQ